MSNADRLRSVATAAPKSLTPEEVSNLRPKERVAYLLESRKDDIAKMMPRHLTTERLLKVAQVACSTTPALLECETASLVSAIGQCAQLGLEPNTILGHAYLVPFNAKRKTPTGEKWVKAVQVIIGYKGLIDLARRSGQIVSIAAHEVCEKDHFELVYGLEEKLEHKPALGDRGETLGFYAVAHLKGGGHAFEWMSVSQIIAIRDESQGWQQAVKFKNTASSPWTKHFPEMGRKTVIRRLAKYLPLSIEFQTGVALDDMASTGRDQNLEGAIDGDWAPVDDMGDPEALTDDTAEQAERAVPQRVDPAPESAPPVAQQRRTARAKEDPPPAARAEFDPPPVSAAPPAPSLLEKFATLLDRAENAADAETAYLLLDEARSLMKEMSDANQAAAAESLDAAVAALKARSAE